MADTVRSLARDLVARLRGLYDAEKRVAEEPESLLGICARLEGCAC